jgi:two-component system sensor histidine kinase ChiS
MTKTPHILIVEDDTWLAEHFIRTIEAAGMSAETVPHALAAIDAIDTRLPDVLVLDLLLAGPNAFTLLHELRSHEDLAAIPVIVCTNSAGDIAAEDIAAYGVREVLDKATMRPDDLLAAIKRIIL